MTTKKGIVETCLLKISDPFTLVVLAAYRSQELASGISPCVATEGSKDALVSLKEISSGNLDMGSLKDRMVKSLQKFAFLSEEGLSDAVPAMNKPTPYAEKASFGAHALFQKSDADLVSTGNLSNKNKSAEDHNSHEEDLDSEKDFLFTSNSLDLEDSLDTGEEEESEESDELGEEEESEESDELDEADEMDESDELDEADESPHLKF